MENFEKQNSIENKEPSVVSEDNVTNRALANELGRSPQYIKNIAERFRSSNPEYFIQQRDKIGRMFPHYTKELTDVIRAEIEKENIDTPSATIEEITKNALSKELNVSIGPIERIAEEYKESHPEFFVQKRDKMGRVFPHYTKELADIIRNQIIKQSDLFTSKAGFEEITNLALADEMGISKQKVQEIAKEYNTSHPELFVTRKDKMGKNRTHYTKELADIIREKINNTDAIPEASFGEITINDLAEELGRDREKIQKIADSYKKSNPEYFVLKRKKFIWKGVERQQTSLHYTKELADIIREKIIQEETDTPGASFDEITNNALAKETGNSPQYIKKIAEEYKLSNPEYFTFRKGKNEKIALHYTKELADIIRQKGKNIAEAPQDWESTEGIAERLGISKEEVEKMAKKIRQEHQGEFGKFKDRNEG